MIIDKDKTYKKRNFFNLFMFQLKADNIAKGILSYNPRPIFKGMVEFAKIGDLENARLETYRFWKRINPADLKNFAIDLEKNLKPS